MPKLTELELLYVLVGQRIKKAREKADLSQFDLSEKVGLARTSIVNIEAGNQRLQLHDLYRIAIVLSAPIDDLLPACTNRVLMSQAEALEELTNNEH